MSRKTINRIIRLGGTLMAFALVAYLLLQQGWADILAGLQAIPPWRFWAAISLMMLSRIAVAFRWHTLLATAQVGIPLSQSLRITFSGLFASNFLPTTIGGDVIRMAMILRLRTEKVTAAASLVVDRLVGMAGMASATLLGINALLSTGVFDGGPAGAIVGQPFLKFFRESLKKLSEALRLWLRSPRGLLGAFIWTWAHQFCLFAVLWLMLGGLGSEVNYWLVGGMWSLTYFVTLLPISINGLGVQELSMTAIFSTVGGVSVANAATAALLVRTLQMLASVPGALFLPDILRLREERDE